MWIVVALVGCSTEELGPVDEDGDGFTTEYDCDDTDPAIYPTADELCDTIDNDCDGQVDEEDAADAVTFYADADFDGFGDPAIDTVACTGPPGFSAEGTDCDDSDPAAWPGASELCDGIDNDCDGEVDEEPADAAAWYPDSDGDGYGVTEGLITGCDPGGYAPVGGDCEDEDSAIYPGATEVCRDGKVNACATLYADAMATCAWPADLTEGSALTLSGESGNLGWAALSADLDGDGASELAVGAPGTGRAWVLPGPLTAGGSLSGLGDSLSGDALTGIALAAADLDGDGYSDLAIGSAASVWLVHGPITAGGSLSAPLEVPGIALATGDAGLLAGDPAAGAVHLLDHDGEEIGTLSGSEGAGMVVASAGDVDGDGLADVLIGAPDGADAWLLLGPVTGSADLSDVGAVISGSSGSRAGAALAGPGDLDGDGYDDFAVGAPIDSFYTGLVGLFPGSASPAAGSLAAAPATITGEFGMLFGGALDGVGDLDGDGLPELLVGSGYFDVSGTTLIVEDGPGEAYLFLTGGGLSALSGARDAAAASVTFSGPQRSFGLTVFGLDDLGGDGLPEVLISSGESDEDAYVFVGPGI